VTDQYEQRHRKEREHTLAFQRLVSNLSAASLYS
jgi:hypothetical protein